MRISELMVLGSTLIQHVPFSGDGKTNGCAIQCAVKAAGRSLTEGWLSYYRLVNCEECGCEEANPAFMVIHLNDFHRWPIDKIAQWVASVEPAETQAQPEPSTELLTSRALDSDLKRVKV
jgi:hypothetical protein